MFCFYNRMVPYGRKNFHYVYTFSRQWLSKLKSSGLWHCVVLLAESNISREHTASIIRVEESNDSDEKLMKTLCVGKIQVLKVKCLLSTVQSASNKCYWGVERRYGAQWQEQSWSCILCVKRLKYDDLVVVRYEQTPKFVTVSHVVARLESC